MNYVEFDKEDGWQTLCKGGVRQKDIVLNSEKGKAVVALRKTQNAKIVSLPVSKRKGISDEKLKLYSGILLRGIENELGDSVFFTREDLIQISVFGHVSTIYRYSMICTLLRHLIMKGDIVEKNRTDLCLRDQSGAYSDIPLRERYIDTITAVVGSFRAGSRMTVMQIVGAWKTDNDLTTNNKRVAVRGAIRKLVRDGKLVPAGDFQYMRK